MSINGSEVDSYEYEYDTDEDNHHDITQQQIQEQQNMVDKQIIVNEIALLFGLELNEPISLDLYTINPIVSSYTMCEELYSQTLDVPMIAYSMMKKIYTLKPLLGISSEDIFVLLAFYDWQFEKLVEDWTDKEEICMRTQYGIHSPLTDEELNTLRHDVADGQDTIWCSVGIDEYPKEDMWSLPCKHLISNDAWKAYLINILETNPRRIATAKCMQSGCNESLRPSVWTKFLTETHYRLKYQEWFIRNYISGNKNTVMCPGLNMNISLNICSDEDSWSNYYIQVPLNFSNIDSIGSIPNTNPLHSKITFKECNQIISKSDLSSTDVQCTNGHIFCFSCSNIGGHRPTTCYEYENFQHILQNDLTLTDTLYIRSNFSPCPNPKCKRPTERSSGCNKVVCALCKTTYCWICKRFPYEDSHSYPKEAWTCNLPPPTTVSLNPDEELLLWTLERLHAHKNAIILMTNPTAILSLEAAIYDASNVYSLSAQQKSIFYKAKNSLIQAENVICASYIRAYFISKKISQLKTISNKNSSAMHLDEPEINTSSSTSPTNLESILSLFRTQQGQLEGQTDMLHNLLKPETIRKSLFLTVSSYAAQIIHPTNEKNELSNNEDNNMKLKIKIDSSSSKERKVDESNNLESFDLSSSTLSATSLQNNPWQNFSIRLENTATTLIRFANNVSNFVEGVTL